jgi:hypothetical protein
MNLSIIEEAEEKLVQTIEVCPDLLCGVDIRRAIQVWFLGGKEGNDTQ